MSKNKFLVSLGLLLLLTAALAGRPAVSNAQDGSAGTPNFIFVNYIGQEMTFDLDDVTRTIPGTNTAPEGGRLELTLAPGEHKFAANVPGVRGSAGEFTIEPGTVVAKAARFEQTSPVLEKGILVTAPKDYVLVFDFDPLAAPVESAAQVEDMWQPSPATPGKASLVWVNYSRDELTLDLNGQLYKIAPPVGDVPGRLQLEVEPGEYSYTASVPYGSLNGKLNATPDAVQGYTITADLPPEPDYDVGEEFDLFPEVVLRLFEEDFTNQAAAAPEIAGDTAAADMAVQPETAPAQPETPTTGDGLLIKNYAGDTLTFTINDQVFAIANNAERTVTLPPGEYTYTASIPFVASSGSVNLGPGQGTILSVAVNVNHDVLSVYQN